MSLYLYMLCESPESVWLISTFSNDVFASHIYVLLIDSISKILSPEVKLELWSHTHVHACTHDWLGTG